MFLPFYFFFHAGKQKLWKRKNFNTHTINLKVISLGWKSSKVWFVAHLNHCNGAGLGSAALKTSPKSAFRDRGLCRATSHCMLFISNPVPSPSISNPFVYLVPLSIYRNDPFLPTCPRRRFQFLKICNSQSVAMPSEADKSTWHAENYTTVNNNRISFVLFWHFTIKWNANAWPLGEPFYS